ncbi:hypothetical protein ATK17_2039 [Branchiibius hedensis]|uniref:Uncharacterized protein n=1 Tax=Branchiibius hedensis TaxID=672460 RepID=A0A2Y8ZS09_9MICO|nr:hypothetical protein ATK17_2039 [Branchiibius hedensis]SSA34714.1 hypothetical protein SAMN04489750_2039 [Branchiibius hedensis]
MIHRHEVKPAISVAVPAKRVRDGLDTRVDFASGFNGRHEDGYLTPNLTSDTGGKVGLEGK